MNVPLRLKSLLVGTPVGRFGDKARTQYRRLRLIKYPELSELYEEPEAVDAFLDKSLRTNSCCIDVGAHIGSFTANLRRKCPDGRIIAFEPSPIKCMWLRRRFPTVEVIEAAVSDRNGVEEFCEDLPGRICGRLTSVDPIAGVNRHNVNVCRLDDSLRDLNRIDLLKLDIEGGELAALRGARGLLKRHRPIILFECGSEYETTLRRREIFDLLVESDYTIFTPRELLFGKGPLSFDEFRKCGLYPFRAFNFIAKPYFS